MLLDPDTLARVVVCGVPLAGTATLMAAFAKSREVPLTSLAFPGDGARGVQMSWRRIQIATWAGGVFADDAWDVLIAESTHLVLVIDGQAEREPQTTKFLDHISTLATLPNARSRSRIVGPSRRATISRRSTPRHSTVRRPTSSSETP